MAPARPAHCGSESVICNPNAIGPPQWAPIGPTMATCAAHIANPARPARLFGVPQHSGLYFFTFVIDFDTLQTFEIIEKPQENLGFSTVFMNSANLLQNRQNAASGCPGTLKMEAFGTQNGTSGQHHEPRSSKLRPKSAQMSLPGVKMGAQLGPGGPTCCSRCS